jgi:glycosyltransferase involved in cell wall biosynthesis
VNFSVLLTPYSYRLGLTYHMAQHLVAFHNEAQAAGVHVHIASPPQEQFPGLWEQVRRCYPPEAISELHDEKSDLARVATRVLEREPRLVAHVQGTRQLLALAPVRQQHAGRVKIVYTVNSFRNATWRGLPYSWYLGRLLRRHADYTHFLSPRSAREFVGAKRVLAGGRGGIMLQGVEDWPDEPPVPPAAALDPQLSAVLDERGSFRFLYLATVHAGKGHHWLIQGLTPVLQRHPEVYVIMPGRQDPRLVAKLRELAEQRGVARQVILSGLLDRRYVPWLISRCQAGLVASRSETFGHTIVEPMVGGRPVIGTRRGIGEYLIMDYFTGIGFEYGDRAALAHAAEYLATHPDEARRMGENAARLVRPLYTWNNTGAAHLRIYQSLWTDAVEGADSQRAQPDLDEKR